MKILIFGVNGQLGSYLYKTLKSKWLVIGTSRHQQSSDNPEIKVCDFLNQNSVVDLIDEFEPNIIINCAAYTKVDLAESNLEENKLVNAIIPGVIAQKAKEKDIIFIHFSTDYVFNGNKQEPYLETDITDPINSYGEAKLLGEHNILSSGGKNFIFRTSWVYGPNGHNFLNTMLKLVGKSELKIVNDQIGAPTSVLAIGDAIQKVLTLIQDKNVLIPVSWYGVYHLTCQGETSWYGFAQDIFKLWKTCGQAMDIPSTLPIPSSDYVTPAPRPKNSRLNCEKFHKTFSIELQDWQSALGEVIVIKSKNLESIQ